MTRDQVIELLRAADPMSESSSESESFPSVTTLLDRIDERSTDVQTQQRRVASQPNVKHEPRWRRPATAVAALALVVGAVAVAVGILAGGDDPASPPTTPAELGEALHRATLEGDWAPFYDLFAPDATFVAAFERGEPELVESINHPLSDPFSLIVSWPHGGKERTFDWNGDGAINSFDMIAGWRMMSYAMGISSYEQCTETDSMTLVCVEQFPGRPPFGNDVSPGVTIVHTVADGVVTELRYEIQEYGNSNFSNAKIIQYIEWVRSEHQDRNPDNVLFGPGGLALTPDTVEVHRELIEEWVDTL